MKPGTWPVLPDCRFRTGVSVLGVECGHTSVRSAGRAVPPDACTTCEWRGRAESSIGHLPVKGEEAQLGSANGGHSLSVENQPLRADGRLRPHVALVIDRRGWAFETDARGLIKHLADQFTFSVVTEREATAYPERLEADLMVVFWWKTLLRLRIPQGAAVICGLFDSWSWSLFGVDRLQQAFDRATAVLIGNALIAADVLNHPAEFRLPAVFECEEGVDCDTFVPQPFPNSFCLGWAGTTVNAKSYANGPDGKGLGLILDAAQQAEIPLLAAKRRDRNQAAGQPTHIPHDQMPEGYYRHISAHCIGSYSEGAPLTAAEALACGRPVIATNVGIIPRLVQNGVNGYVVARDVPSLATAMRDVQRQGPERMSAAARRSALLLDWSRQAPLWAHCFHSALELRTRQRRSSRLAQRPEYASGEWQVQQVAAPGTS